MYKIDCEGKLLVYYEHIKNSIFHYLDVKLWLKENGDLPTYYP